VEILDDHRRGSNPNTKGRMTRDEIGILRSAIVLASSGLDASMKRLVNDVARNISSKNFPIPGRLQAYGRQ
jgi:hypothetical protein